MINRSDNRLHLIMGCRAEEGAPSNRLRPQRACYISNFPVLSVRAPPVAAGGSSRPADRFWKVRHRISSSNSAADRAQLTRLVSRLRYQLHQVPDFRFVIQMTVDVISCGGCHFNWPPPQASAGMRSHTHTSSTRTDKSNKQRTGLLIQEKTKGKCGPIS